MKKLIINLLGIILLISLYSFSTKKTDIEIIKEKVVNELGASIASDGRIQSLIESLEEYGTWPGRFRYLKILYVPPIPPA